MSRLDLQAKVNLSSASATNAEMTTWECALTFTDLEGIFSGTDVTVGDILVFDTGAYETGTFTFYEVTAIVTPDYAAPTVAVQYMAFNNNNTGTPDLSYVVGSDGMITRPSSHLGLLPVVSRDVQILSDRFTEYVQNYNFTRILDNQSNNQTVPNFPKTNGDTSIIYKGMVVYIDPNDETKVLRATAADYSKSRAAGLSVTPSALASTAMAIQCEGTFELPTAAWDMLTGDVGGLKAGKEYFLSDAILGGLITPPNVNAAAVTKLGKAVSSTVLDLNIEPPIML